MLITTDLATLRATGMDAALLDATQAKLNAADVKVAAVLHEPRFAAWRHHEALDPTGFAPGFTALPSQMLRLARSVAERRME